MIREFKKNKGFVILFAVTLSAILLSIALGVANISQREIKFGTSAKDTNNAFLAADIGIECALLHDKSTSSSNVFTGTGSMNCAGTSITPAQSPAGFWTFAVNGLGSASQSCAKVTVDKRASPATTVIARGYNIGSGSCDPTNPNRVERQLEVTYTAGASLVATPVVTISANPTSGTVNVVNPQITWSATNSPTSCSFTGDWTNTSGGSVSGTNVSQGVLTSARPYTYTLSCSNAQGTGPAASATVTVSAPVNNPPTANANNMYITPPSTSGGMNVSGSDTDGTVTNLAWAFVSGPGPTPVISPATSNSSSMLTNFSNLTVAGRYNFRLTATDNQGATGTATIYIDVLPPAPTNLTASCPAPGNSASISWTLPSGYTLSRVRVRDTFWDQDVWNAPSTNSDTGSTINVPTIGAHTYTVWVDTRTATYDGYLLRTTANFTCTGSSVPIVATTSPVTNITATAATGGGTITSNGGSPVTVSGVAWGVSVNPTTAGSRTTDGWATGGPWSSSMTGLLPSTVYHVRAYGTNSLGTGYGADVTFTTANAAGSASFLNPGTFSWTAPAGVTSVTVEAWGGGAGGAVGSGADGRGGGGGAYSKSTGVAVVPGNSYTVVVGAGGAMNGGTGGDSTFNTSSVVAKGGTVAAGGSAAASTGVTKFSGGTGGIGGSQKGGGGGSSAGNAANGNNGATGTSGGLGGTAPTGGGAGGRGGNAGTGTNGTAGTAPGGAGGGGAWDPEGFGYNGGAGAPGKMIISY